MIEVNLAQIDKPIRDSIIDIAQEISLIILEKTKSIHTTQEKILIAEIIKLAIENTCSDEFSTMHDKIVLSGRGKNKI